MFSAGFDENGKEAGQTGELTVEDQLTGQPCEAHGISKCLVPRIPIKCLVPIIPIK